MNTQKLIDALFRENNTRAKNNLKRLESLEIRLAKSRWVFNDDLEDSIEKQRFLLEESFKKHKRKKIK